ncbi:MAG TPA: transcription-repair coupling factor, partial [Dehalococcoidia bacterium]|nr:transcription-repair coupling factor [Dehalococcoidia bacterium]
LNSQTLDAGPADALRFPIQPPPAFAGRLRDLGRRLAELRAQGAGVAILSQQAARLAELYREEVPLALIEGDLERCPADGEIIVGTGSLGEGLELRREDGRIGLVVLTDGEIFGVSKVRRPVRTRRAAREDHLADISEGDYVVHLEHGVGRFEGLRRLSLDGQAKEYLVLSYAENDKLYVPVDQANRIARYIGARDEAPRLTRLGGTEWARAKERVRKAVKDIAADLLRIYAARQVRPGHAYPPDTTWQIEMEQAFPYVETADQLTAVEAVKEDLEAPRPMDRLICGDVGYGKTEVALRAAFKVVQDGKQVAVLVPTTVLAQQHFRTFSERLTAFPIRVAMLSRFLNDREQAEVVAGLKDGSIDICIGTHRLLQTDVVFKDPGLLIVDEEQRFGVLHKEQLKRLRTEIDVLTMTATPIPRTLYQALIGARDMSTIETPPEERLPVRTYLTQFDEEIVRQAILRELDRGGQVYFVHNRVRSIGVIAHQLMELVPEATFGIGHGQMPEEALERVMAEFGEGKIDVLVCSTIIESGLDIPNVNTIIINQANRLGLSQLYQLRGRVGRSATRAYAYLLYDKDARLTSVAEQRLRAIFEATELGSGFRIAQKDLEIRGAGNLLGAEQSGHVSAVGFDLYTRLLAEAIADLKGEPVPAGAGLPDPAGGPTLDL